MARRKLGEQQVRKLLKNSGGSIQVTLPIEAVRNLRWQNKQKVVIKQSGNKLIIEDWKR